LRSQIPFTTSQSQAPFSLILLTEVDGSIFPLPTSSHFQSKQILYSNPPVQQHQFHSLPRPIPPHLLVLQNPHFQVQLLILTIRVVSLFIMGA